MKAETRKRILLGSIVICIVWASTLTGYNLTRRRLTRPMDADWKRAIVTPQDTSTYVSSSLYLSGRAQAVAIREYMLEHANDHDSRMEFELSYALAEMPSPDWPAVEEAFAQSALKLVRSLSHEPTLKDFENAGVRTEQTFYGFSGYPKPVLFTDIEGGGKRSILLGFPFSMPGVCVMLHRSGKDKDWEAIPLLLGESTLGMWQIHIGKEHRAVVAMLFGSGYNYDPRERMVLWVWQNGRMERALTVPIPADQSWHMKLQSDAPKPTVIKGSVQSRRTTAAQTADLVFHWNGTRFDEAASLGADGVDGRSPLQHVNSLIGNRDYTGAKELLGTILGGTERKALSSSNNLSAYYMRSLCEAILGDYAGFRTDISAAHQIAPRVEREDTYMPPEGEISGRYLRDITTPYKLVDQLINSGFAMALLRSTAERSRLKPAEIIAAAHFKLEKMQATPIGPSGNPAEDIITEVSWPFGSAVLDWRPGQDGKGWSTRLLAYGETGWLHAKENEEPFGQDSDNVFRIGASSDAALDVTPAPAEVHLVAVSKGHVQVRYVGSKGSGVANLIYSDGEFIDEAVPNYRTVQEVEKGVDRAEERIFAEHNYARAFADLQDLEAECEDLRINPKDQRDWMGEIGYCEAICLRHLGNNRRAENILNALQSLPSSDMWLRLAGMWLK